MRNQKILPRNSPSPAQSDRGIINVNEVIVWIRGVYGIENDGLYLDHYERRSRWMQQKTKVIMKKRNLQLIFDRNTIHSESFGLNWTMKKKWTGSMTSPLRTVRLLLGSCYNSSYAAASLLCRAWDRCLVLRFFPPKFHHIWFESALHIWTWFCALHI